MLAKLWVVYPSIYLAKHCHWGGGGWGRPAPTLVPWRQGFRLQQGTSVGVWSAQTGGGGGGTLAHIREEDLPCYEACKLKCGTHHICPFESCKIGFIAIYIFII